SQRDRAADEGLLVEAEGIEAVLVDGGDEAIGAPGDLSAQAPEDVGQDAGARRRIALDFSLARLRRRWPPNGDDLRISGRLHRSPWLSPARYLDGRRLATTPRAASSRRDRGSDRPAPRRTRSE